MDFNKAWDYQTEAKRKLGKAGRCNFGKPKADDVRDKVYQSYAIKQRVQITDVAYRIPSFFEASLICG